MKNFRLLFVAAASAFALSSCAFLQCERCAAKQAAANAKAMQEYEALQAALALTPPDTAPATETPATPAAVAE